MPRISKDTIERYERMIKDYQLEIKGLRRSLTTGEGMELRRYHCLDLAVRYLTRLDDVVRNSDEVLRIAKKFEQFVTTGVVPEMAEQPA